jgi:hypothetical protein
MEKKIGVFVCGSLTNVLNLDYDLYETINKKYKNFFIVDLSIIYGLKSENKPKLFRIFRPKNFKDLDKFLKNNLNIFFNHIPRTFFFLNFHIFINKIKIINIELIRGNSIQLEELYYTKNNYKLIIKKRLIRGFYKFLSLFNIVKNYDYLFISTKNIKKYYHNTRDKFLNKIFFTKKFFKHERIIFINDKAFDLSGRNKKTEKFIVYIDSPVMKIKTSDIPLNAYPNKFDRNNFYESLAKALLTLSKKYKKKVLVNLHPKTDYKNVKIYFKKFIIKKFDLWNSIDKAYLVTGLASTAYSYVIFNNKRRLVLFSKNMGIFHTHRVNILSKNYKILMQDIDKEIFINEANLRNPSSLRILKKNIKLNDKIDGKEKILKFLDKFLNLC